LYRIVVEQGEAAGVEAASQARTDGLRGVPVAMQIIQVGNALSRLGRDEAARRVYAFASLVDPDAPWGHLGLGQWYEDQGSPDDAVRSYCDVLQHDPNQPHALEYLATLGHEVEDGACEERSTTTP
jgi:predicted Zn-dependent protease